jgi:hypothetical protein
MKVEARYRGKLKWYPGKITRVRLDGTYDIDYDDGEKETNVEAELVRSVGGGKDDDDNKKSSKTKLEEGMKVEARYRGKLKWYPGKITRVRSNGTYDIDYDDEQTLNINHIKIIFELKILKQQLLLFF